MIKTSIATKAGVSTNDVTISILPASVHIVVNIETSATNTYASIANKVDQYLTSTSQATELLGGSSAVTVVNVESAPVPYPVDKDDTNKLPMWGAALIVVFVLLFVAVLAGACLMYYREKMGKPIFVSLDEKAPPPTSSKAEAI